MFRCDAKWLTHNRHTSLKATFRKTHVADYEQSKPKTVQQSSNIQFHLMDKPRESFASSAAFGRSGSAFAFALALDLLVCS